MVSIGIVVVIMMPFKILHLPLSSITIIAAALKDPTRVKGSTG
jgi:hypothetical protein